MHERGSPATKVCEHYGISRKTFYKWYGRYREAGRDFHVLRDLSRRPHSHPRAVPKPVVERIVALRRKTRYGPRRLAYYLSQEGISVSAYGIYRVLQRAGMVQKRRSRPRKKPQSYAMAVPGQRVQVDVQYLPKMALRGRPEPLQQYLYAAIDDCTRLQGPMGQFRAHTSGQCALPTQDPTLLPLSHSGGPDRPWLRVHLRLLHPCAEASPLRGGPKGPGNPPQAHRCGEAGAKRKGRARPSHTRRGVPQLQGIPKAWTQAQRHQTMAVLLQLPATSFIPGVAYATPGTPVLP